MVSPSTRVLTVYKSSRLLQDFLLLQVQLLLREEELWDEERGIVGREERDKETRNKGSGLFGTFRAHIEDCGVLLSK